MDLNLFDTKPLTSITVNDPIKPVSTTTVQPAPPQQKTNFWDTLFKAADSAANVINAVKQPATQTPTYGGGYQVQPVPTQQNNTMKTVLIVGGVAVAGLAAWAIFGKKKKK